MDEGLRGFAQLHYFHKCCHPEWNEGSPLAAFDLIVCCGNNETGVHSRWIDLDALLCIAEDVEFGLRTAALRQKPI